MDAVFVILASWLSVMVWMVVAVVFLGEIWR